MGNGVDNDDYDDDNNNNNDDGWRWAREDARE